jgi:hypothetical protein
VALYLLDFDDNRAETISILDAATHTALDTESAANFQNGVYLVWNIQGHVLIQVTCTGGLNAVVSGLFFATPSSGGQPPPTFPSPHPRRIKRSRGTSPLSRTPGLPEEPSPPCNCCSMEIRSARF